MGKKIKETDEICRSLRLKSQPGLSSGLKDLKQKDINCQNYIQRVIKDNPSIYQIPLNSTKCRQGWSKIALLVEPKKSYHFYRQDSNGFWSHKNGGTPVTHLDFSGKRITDPKKSDSGRYSQFCSYFCVPSNNTIKTQSDNQQRI